MNGAGNGEHFEAGFGGQPGGDQRAAALGGLDHQAAAAQAGDQAIAAREVGRQRLACRAEIR